MIGRNNSGKSAVFAALSYLNGVMTGQLQESDNILTAQERERGLRFELLFKGSIVVDFDRLKTHGAADCNQNAYETSAAFNMQCSMIEEGAV